MDLQAKHLSTSAVCADLGQATPELGHSMVDEPRALGEKGLFWSEGSFIVFCWFLFFCCLIVCIVVTVVLVFFWFGDVVLCFITKKQKQHEHVNTFINNIDN